MMQLAKRKKRTVPTSYPPFTYFFTFVYFKGGARGKRTTTTKTINKSANSKFVYSHRGSTAFAPVQQNSAVP